MMRVYTTAPEAYDGFSTRTVKSAVGVDQRGQTIRIVEMDEADFDWQTGRYASGLHAAYSADLASEMFEGGLWRASA